MDRCVPLTEGAGGGLKFVVNSNSVTGGVDSWHWCVRPPAQGTLLTSRKSGLHHRENIHGGVGAELWQLRRLMVRADSC